MKVLITGIAGFVGSSITRMFLSNFKNIDIIGIDNFSYGYRERLTDIIDDITFIEMDVKNLPHSNIGEVDFIIHCAAIAPLPENQKDIFKCSEQNIANCGAISEFATQHGCENIIFFSSGAIYEGSGNRVCSESDGIETSLIYPTSKFLAEKLFESVAKTYGIKVVSIRLFNLYGPHQDYFRKQPPLLGYLIKNVIEGNEVKLYASKEAKRDYIYIEDLYSLIGNIIRKFPEIENGAHIPVNAGSGEIFSVYDIVHKLESVSGVNIRYSQGDKSDFWNNYPELFNRKYPFKKDFLLNEVDKKSIADLQFAKDFFDWEPKISMETGLEKCFCYAKEIMK